MRDSVEPIIRLQDVHLRLASRAGPVDILRGVSLEVAPASSLGVVGPSGSGKTSLAMIVAGLERATSGRISVAGHDFAALGEDDLALVRGREIGIVFQSFHLVATMTALENVALPLEFRGHRTPFEAARAALGDVGLAARCEHFPAQLSGGERQRVAIARAIVHRPRLLLADEPTGNLDAKAGAMVMDLLFDLHERQNTTLVLITHDTRLADRCERRVTMNDGRICEPVEAGSGS